LAERRAARTRRSANTWKDNYLRDLHLGLELWTMECSERDLRLADAAMTIR
jgi:hypothetical protein